MRRIRIHLAYDGGAFHGFRHAMAAKVLDERFRRLREFCLSIS